MQGVSIALRWSALILIEVENGSIYEGELSAYYLTIKTEHFFVHALVVDVPMLGQGSVGSQSVGMHPCARFDGITYKRQQVSFGAGIRRNLIRPNPFGSCTSIAMPTKVFPY